MNRVGGKLEDSPVRESDHPAGGGHFHANARKLIAQIGEATHPVRRAAVSKVYIIAGFFHGQAIEPVPRLR